MRIFQQFATLDLLSEGRAEMVVGRGSSIEAFPLFGFRLDDYDELFAEKLDLLLKIRANEHVHWSGKYRGGYQELAVDLEGTEVCDWLTSEGITCVLLKYRVTDVGAYPKSGPYPESPMALEDAQRTLGLVRFHAAQWHIDPHKIGVLGFS